MRLVSYTTARTRVLAALTPMTDIFSLSLSSVGYGTSRGSISAYRDVEQRVMVNQGPVDSSGYARPRDKGRCCRLHARDYVLQHPWTSWGFYSMCWGSQTADTQPVLRDMALIISRVGFRKPRGGYGGHTLFRKSARRRGGNIVFNVVQLSY
jgi:hypothetical protein